MSALATLICSIVCWPLLALWRGYVVTILWLWFVVPAFAIRPLSIYESVGLMMVIGISWPLHRNPTEEGDAFINWFGNALGYGLIVPLGALGMGWVWRWLQWGIA